MNTQYRIETTPKYALTSSLGLLRFEYKTKRALLSGISKLVKQGFNSDNS